MTNSVDIHAQISAWVKEIGLTPVAQTLGDIHPPFFGKMVKAGVYSDDVIEKFKKHFKIKDEPVAEVTDSGSGDTEPSPDISEQPESLDLMQVVRDAEKSGYRQKIDAFNALPRANIPIGAEMEIVNCAGEPVNSNEDMPDDLDVMAATQDATWTGKRLAICFPCYRQTNPLTNFALMALFDKSKMRYFQRHNTILVKARNQLADMFLKSDCEWSFWLDDDMIPPIGNAEWFYAHTKKNRQKFPKDAAGANAILRLHSHGRKIVSALYFGRNPTGRAMFAEALRNDEVGRRSDAEARRDAGRNHVKQTAWAATGCVLIHRDVFLAVKARFPELQPQNKAMPFQYFTPDPTDTGGEDRAFFQRASRAGFQSAVDFGTVCGHVGYNIFTDENTKWEKTE